MKLGSELAAIRYNEGYCAIFEILDMQHVDIHPGLIRLLASLDKPSLAASAKSP